MLLSVTCYLLTGVCTRWGTNRQWTRVFITPILAILMDWLFGLSYHL
nr:hypothetical protein [Providencia rettgeri]